LEDHGWQTGKNSGAGDRSLFRGIIQRNYENMSPDER